MIAKRDISIFSVAFASIFLLGCDFSGEEHADQKTYEARMRNAQVLSEKAERLYLEAMTHDAGTDQRNSLLRRAYDSGEKGMNILNLLDEEFGHRAVPEGEVLAHKPIMRSLSELMDHIVRAMSALD